MTANRDDYFADPGTSASFLWRCASRSPWHAMNAAEGPTPRMSSGSLLHALVLEPDTIDDRFYRFHGKKLTNAAKLEWETAEKGGLEVVKDKDWLGVERDANAIREAYGDLIDGATHIEHALYWDCPDTGMRCKALPDIVHPEMGLIDVKRTINGEPRAFERAMSRYGSHFQAAWYCRGARILGRPCLWNWIACEHGGPVTLYSAPAAYLARVEKTVMTAAHHVAECQRTGDWPGYVEQAIEPPDWLSMAEANTVDYAGLELEVE